MSKYKLPTDYTKLKWYERREVRQLYILKQKGKCFFCKEDLLQPAPKKITDKKIDWSYFPENFLKYPIRLQHCRKSRFTEGAVHNYCNAVMWQYHNR